MYRTRLGTRNDIAGTDLDGSVAGSAWESASRPSDLHDSEASEGTRGLRVPRIDHRHPSMVGNQGVPVGGSSAIALGGGHAVIRSEMHGRHSNRARRLPRSPLRFGQPGVPCAAQPEEAQAVVEAPENQVIRRIPWRVVSWRISPFLKAEQALRIRLKPTVPSGSHACR